MTAINQLHTTSWSLIAQCGVTASFYLLLYGTLLRGLFAESYSSHIYSYGVLVPAIASYLAWRKTSELKVVSVVPTLWGCFLLLVAVVLYLIGELLADTFPTRISMVLTLCALTQIIFGTHMLKLLAFPLSYLFLMIPVPYLFVNEIVKWLMFFDAAQAAKIVQLFGVPVFLEENFIHLPNIVLEVADSCSGIASVLALLVLGLAYAYMLPVSPILRLVVVASAVPIAVFANVLRIIITVLLAYNVGTVALDSLFHKAAGVFNFLLSVFLLALIGETLRKKCAKVRRLVNEDAQPVRHEVGLTGWIGTVTSVMILSVAMWMSGIFAADARSAVKGIELETLPSSFDVYAIGPNNWSDRYTDARAEQSITRIYSGPKNIPIELFIGYGANNAGSDRLQSPKLILPAKWGYIWVRSASIEMAEGKQAKANWMLTQRGNDKRLVLYWYQSGERIFGGELEYRLQMLRSRIFNADDGIAVVRIASPVSENESLERVQQRLQVFVKELYPKLSKILDL